MSTKTPERLKTFLSKMSRLVDEAGGDEPTLLDRGSAHMRELIAHDDWLADDFAQPHPVYYRQYLLYCDPLERFSVVSFVWGPGQKTPIHDHTTWGLIGMLRGAEVSHGFELVDGKPVPSEIERLEKGDVAMVSPKIGDIHQVSNAHADQVSISIHVYGGDIGAIERHVFVGENGEMKPFVSGYSNDRLPNVWGRQA